MKNRRMITMLITFMLFCMAFTGCGKKNTAVETENEKIYESAESIDGLSEEQMPEQEVPADAEDILEEKTGMGVETGTGAEEAGTGAMMENEEGAEAVTEADAGASAETEADAGGVAETEEDMQAETSADTTQITASAETTQGTISAEATQGATSAETTQGTISAEATQGATSAETIQTAISAEAAQDIASTETTQTAISAEATRGTTPAATQPVNTGSDGLVYFDINDPTTWEPPHDGMIFDADVGAWMDIQENGIDRRAAEEVWSYMNAERAEAGLNTIAWDEEIYNFACQRAQAIIADFSHNGCGNYSENIEKGTMGAKPNGYNIHSVWHYSQGHYNNYMNARHTKGACAVFVYDGMYYAVEEFTNDSGYGTGGNTTRVINGQTYDVSRAEAEAVDSGNYWIASNGLVVFVLGEGYYSCHSGVEEALAAIDEYEACH